MAAETLSKLNILLVGKTGVGKSSTANSIFREKKFKASVGKSVTKECTQETARRDGIQITVIDTPGVCDTDGMDAAKVIDDFITNHKCELHAICLVIAPPRPTEEEKRAIVQLQTLFGEAMLQYLFVVITNMDKLEEHDVQPKDFLQDFVSEGTDILQTCIQGDRVYGIDNDRRNEKKEQQVQELLDGINKMVSRNKGALYTLHNLEENKKVLKEKDEKLKQKEDEIKRKKEEQRRRKLEIAEQRAREEERKKSEAERLAREKALQEQHEREKELERQKAQEAERKLQAQKEASEKKEKEMQEQHEREKELERQKAQEAEKQLKAQKEASEKKDKEMQEQREREKELAEKQARALEEIEKKLKAEQEATAAIEKALKADRERLEEEQRQHNENAQRMADLEKAKQVRKAVGLGGLIGGATTGLVTAAAVLNPVGAVVTGTAVGLGAAAYIYKRFRD